jgi:hypothetical protein
MQHKATDDREFSQPPKCLRTILLSTTKKSTTTTTKKQKKTALEEVQINTVKCDISSLMHASEQQNLRNHIGIRNQIWGNVFLAHISASK